MSHYLNLPTKKCKYYWQDGGNCYLELLCLHLQRLLMPLLYGKAKLSYHQHRQASTSVSVRSRPCMSFVYSLLEAWHASKVNRAHTNSAGQTRQTALPYVCAFYCYAPTCYNSSYTAFRTPLLCAVCPKGLRRAHKAEQEKLGSASNISAGKAPKQCNRRTEGNT